MISRNKLYSFISQIVSLLWLKSSSDFSLQQNKLPPYCGLQSSEGSHQFSGLNSFPPSSPVKAAFFLSLCFAKLLHIKRGCMLDILAWNILPPDLCSTWEQGHTYFAYIIHAQHHSLHTVSDIYWLTKLMNDCYHPKCPTDHFSTNDTLPRCKECD